MKGILKTRNGRYIVRTDHHSEPSVWAWEIHGCYDRAMTHKWVKPPRGVLEKFDIDNPPETVSYQPLLG